MTTKKFLSWLCTVLIIVSTIPFAVLAAQDPMIIVDTVEANSGDTVDVTVSMENNPGVIGVGLSVSYSDVLTLTKVTDGRLLGSAMHSSNYSKKPYYLNWANDTVAENFTNDGVIVTLTFKVDEQAPSGEYPVSLSYNNDDFEIFNYDAETVEFEIINGSVVIPSQGQECDHSNAYNVTGRTATCKESGLTDGYFCPDCNTWLVEQEIIPPDLTNHVGYGTEKRGYEEATCEKEGYTGDVYCLGCGNKIGNGATIEKLPHTEEIVPGVEATCTSTGLTEGKKCSVCGETLVEQEVIGKKDHTPGDPTRENEVAATCTKEGSYDEVICCTVCKGEISRETKTIEKIPHTEEIVPGVEATCTSTGLTEGKKCSVCGETLVEQEVIGKKDHTPGDPTRENEVAATCKEKGSYDEVIRCTVCEALISREAKEIEIDPSNHADYGTKVVNAKAATCKEDGYTGDTVCAGCEALIEAGSVISKETVAHTPGEAMRENEVAATCKEKGNYDEVIRCTVCEALISREAKEIEIDPTNHADYGTKVENAKAATCEEAGYTGDTVCLGCGEVITAGISIDPLGHSFTNYVSDGNASCTEDGTKTATCDRCDATDTITDEGSATGHIDADGDSICDNCGADVTPENTCEYCGKVHEGFFGKIVQFFHNIFLKLRKFFGGFGDIHLHSYESVETEPTCTEQGYTTHTCKICGRTYTDSYTDALGHNFGEWVTDVKPTCKAEGHQYRICDRCGEKEEQSIPISSVHVDVGEDGQCDVCGKTGVCSFCGRIHNGFLGGLVKGVHNVLYTITRFFKK